ncbi:hypothetical protein [Flavobacterium hydatis]|uniref:hypothetical protein n=1 Tax=Flavobacterium hydatis TaxID=991 RepID=UPI000B1B2F8D|nr:hypothetical protein [Flavobacterium hydatis]
MIGKELVDKYYIIGVNQALTAYNIYATTINLHWYVIWIFRFVLGLLIKSNTLK